MGMSWKDLTRRDFLELATGGAAGGAVTGLEAPSVFAAHHKPKRGGTLTIGMGFMIQTPDPQRYSGG